jgi:hypothetical protein
MARGRYFSRPPSLIPSRDDAVTKEVNPSARSRDAPADK